MEGNGRPPSTQLILSLGRGRERTNWSQFHINTPTSVLLTTVAGTASCPATGGWNRGIAPEKKDGNEDHDEARIGRWEISDSVYPVCDMTKKKI